ncbi:MAG TPA: aconitase X catalytic domain-containing protein [Thermomicrobiales bacterium]|nr:aconitase X catalytic domain-containing protein [Thermomicrobiales bacterium]
MNSTVEFSNLHLNDGERSMLQGELGPATALAMRILARMAPLYGADRFIDVTRAHIDGIVYEGNAGLAFAERLADLGGQVRVPTSLNVMSMDRTNWRQLGQDPSFATNARRLGSAYVRMGAVPTFTCAPYQTEWAPSFGEQIAWSESNAVAYANSVIGARSNRYGDYLDISCALIGRVPASGLHLTENRRGTHLFRLDRIPQRLQERDEFYPVLGYLLGQSVTNGVPVVDGLSVMPASDQLKSLAAAAASSGAIALFHLVGVTPEAPTLREAFQGAPVPEAELITLERLRKIRGMLTTATADQVDVVAFGSPHASLQECLQLAELMDGRTARVGMQVFVTTSRGVKEILSRNGALAKIEAFGTSVVADTCIAVAPLVRPGARVLMTNSGKYAHYGPGIIGVESIYGSTEECVQAAITGRPDVDDSVWH